MPDTTISAVDKSLDVLLQAEKDFPGYSLDFCSGYVSTDGVLLLKRMLKTAPKVRAIVGLNATNRVSAFQMLRDDCEVEVYVYVTSPFTLFHPKIYFGTLNAQAWAMVGSSNLTKSGLSMNVEQSLFITGQRHTEPFISIEAQIAAFRKQAYLFDADIEKMLVMLLRSLSFSVRTLSRRGEGGVGARFIAPWGVGLYGRPPSPKGSRTCYYCLSC